MVFVFSFVYLIIIILIMYRVRRRFTKRPRINRRKTYRYRNKSKTFGPLTSIRVPGSSVLPQRMTTQFRYLARLTLSYDGSAGSSSAINLKANSLTDPLGGSGSVQPPMFDEMMAFYQRYQVLSCAVKLTFTNLNELPIVVYIAPLTDLTDTFNLATTGIMPGSVIRTMGSINGSNSVLVVKNYSKTKNIVGVTNTDDLQGTNGSDPVRLWYWHISTGPALSGYGSDYTISVLIETVYYTLLSDPQPVALS